MSGCLLAVVMVMVLLQGMAWSMDEQALKDRVTQARNAARNRAANLEVKNMAEAARQTAQTMRLPANHHTREGQETAARLIDQVNAPAFQEQLRCQQATILASRQEGAAKEASVGPDAPPMVTGNLYLFLSSALPEASMRSLLAAVAHAGGQQIIPVLQGLPRELPDKAGNSRYFSRVLRQQPECRNSGANRCPWLPVTIQVNPARFSQYAITQVPALVYDNGQDAWVIQGEAELAFLLEKLAQAANSPALTNLSTRLRGAP